MAKIDLIDNSWVDLVFEGKNQAYGAYQLRKNTGVRNLKALIVMFVAFIAIAAIVYAKVSIENYIASQNAAIEADVELASLAEKKEAKVEKKDEPEVEKILNEHTTEEGINPIAKIKMAKKELDAEKTAHNSKMTDEQYQEALKKLKKGELPNGEKVPTMTVIIRPLNTATYENMVAALDEMLISNIDKYVIDNVDKMSQEDKDLIAKAGVK